MKRYGNSFLTYMIGDNRSQEPGNRGIHIRKIKSFTGSNQKNQAALCGNEDTRRYTVFDINVQYQFNAFSEPYMYY
jgi:hypothetical protein